MRTGRPSSCDCFAANAMTTGMRPSMPVTSVARFKHGGHEGTQFRDEAFGIALHEEV
jgi:hypothetical protein